MRAPRPRAFLLALLALLLLAGCATDPPPSTSAQPTAAGVRVMVVGDSITEGDSPDFDDGAFGRQSWAAYVENTDVQLVGGWAHSGATTEDMLTGLRERTGAQGPSPDVLLLMAGSNDVDAGVGFATVAEQLIGIAQIAGADRVVISAIPPEDGSTDEVTAFNVRLRGLAARERWQFVDPMRELRDANGEWLPGMSADGVHPTPEAARIIARALQPALVG